MRMTVGDTGEAIGWAQVIPGSRLSPALRKEPGASCLFPDTSAQLCAG